MNCNCRITEAVISAVILVFAFWVTSYSKWVIVTAAVVLLLHSLSCKNCGSCSDLNSSRTKSVKKRKKRK